MHIVHLFLILYNKTDIFTCKETSLRSSASGGRGREMSLRSSASGGQGERGEGREPPFSERKEFPSLPLSPPCNPLSPSPTLLKEQPLRLAAGAGSTPVQRKVYNRITRKPVNSELN